VDPSSNILTYRTGMKSFEKIARLISAGFNWVALAALGIMLGIVSANIVGAKFLGKPFPGAMDLLSLLGLVIIGFSAAQTYLMGRHIKVDFVSILLPARIRKGIRCVSISLCILLFLAAVWRLFLYARDLQINGETSMTVNIPFSPFAYALAIAFIPLVMLLCVQLYRICKGEKE
jgi:TRAP-type C4-dicarboxylate transport system permease small subunit